MATILGTSGDHPKKIIKIKSKQKKATILGQQIWSIPKIFN
jgi:hypothetical protein